MHGNAHWQAIRGWFGRRGLHVGVTAAYLVLVGVFVEAAKFLLWVGLVIIIIAVIAWLMRMVRRNA